MSCGFVCRGRCPHRPVTRVVHFHVRLNGEMLCYHPVTPFHSTDRGGSAGLRDDVGIVPYDHDGLHSTQHTLVNI